MYPGGSGGPGNHKKGFCSDGAMQLPKKTGQNEDPPRDDQPKSHAPPAWPQPIGIFNNGNKFHPYVFLEKINEMYEKVVVDRDSGADFVLEHAAFASLLTRRTIQGEDGAVLFKLFDIANEPPIPEELIVVKDNHKHLRIDCLQDSDGSH